MAIKELETEKSLPKSELQGLLNLLEDSEEKTLALIAQQLSSLDNNSVQTLHELAQSSSNSDLIDNWYYVSRLSLRYLIEEWRKKPDLETGLFLIAQIEFPGLNTQKYKDMLDNYAQRISSRINKDSSTNAIIQAINHVLYYEEGLSGNQISYYDLNNNFLNSVLDTKTGNPIILSSIYILVAKRLGLDIKGVGTPGHFIVKFEDELVDAFFGGREITKDECIIRAQELGVFWRDEYLDPIDDVSIVARCIRNLIAIYKKHNDLDKSSDVNELLKLL